MLKKKGIITVVTIALLLTSAIAFADELKLDPIKQLLAEKNLTVTVENQIGVTKGTALETEVSEEFGGETSEVGLYLAMARQAQREGYPQIAETLKAIAWDEAGHAARFAEMNGKISTSTKENIDRMLAGELGANKEKFAAALQAKDLQIDEANRAFGEAAMDEGRHAKALAGLLTQYFKK